MATHETGRFDFDQIAELITPEELAIALGAEKKGRRGWRCPVRDKHNNGDRNPSFRPFRDGGRTAAVCHGCGLKGSPVQLYAEVHGCAEQEAASRLAEIVGLHPTPSSASCTTRIIETYLYVDEEGQPLYRKARTSPKGFFYQQPDDQGGWMNGLGDRRRVLYRLPEVIKAVEQGQLVYVVEGEKDVHAIEGASRVATTPGGAGNWRQEFSGYLRRADVVIVADKDPQGREHARQIEQQLCGVARSVRIVEAATGNDSHDHVSAGHGLEDFIPVDLSATGETKTRLLWSMQDVFDGGFDGSRDPQSVAPFFAWRGRTTLLASREKWGKSTLATALAVAVSRGEQFLGIQAVQGPVLYLALEEHCEDVTRRFTEFGSEVKDPWRAVSRLSSPYEDYEKALQEFEGELGGPPALIIVDSLSVFASGLVTDASSASQWVPLMGVLTDSARVTGAAVVLLHHTTKRDNTYRDSTAIGAGVDAIIQMRKGNEEGVRDFSVEARWPTPSFSICLVERPGGLYGYELYQADLASSALAFVTTHPGCSLSAVIKGVHGRNEEVSDVVYQLIDTGELVNRGSRYALKLYVRSEDGEEPSGSPVPADPSGTDRGAGEASIIPRAETGVGNKGREDGSLLPPLPHRCTPERERGRVVLSGGPERKV